MSSSVGVRTRAQLEAVAAEVKIPIILGGTGPELSDKAYLAGQGVRVSLQGHQPIAAAVQAVYDTMKALRDGTPPAKVERVASAAFMKQVTREADYDRWTKEFLGG